VDSWQTWRKGKVMKRLVASLVLALLLSGALLPVAFARGAGVVGTYTIADHGQGGWAGGPLRADGTVGGGGAVSFSTPAGQVVGLVTGGTWSGTLAAGQTVQVCLDLQQLHGPSGALPPVFCAPIVVDAGPVVLLGTTFRVTTTA
jgi:hypothetical protein